MNFVPASPASVVAFLVIVAAVIVAFLLAVFHAYRGEPRSAWRGPLGISVLAGAWIGFCSAVVASGRMATLPFYGLPFFFGAILLVSAFSGLMPLGRRLAVATPSAALVGFQAFRLPLELVLHQWAQEGTIPTTMAWSGQNWDIIAGVMALVAASFAARRRAVVHWPQWGNARVSLLCLSSA